MENQFYIKTNGLVLIVIRHLGAGYSFVRSNGKAMPYFHAAWNDLCQYMEKDKCYVIAATHKVGSSSFAPFAILAEMSEPEAKQFNQTYYDMVMAGQWDTHTQAQALIEGAASFQEYFWKKKHKQEMEKAIDSLEQVKKALKGE